MIADIRPTAALTSLIALSLLAMAQMPADARADDKPEKKTISTAGKATVRVKPDAARVFFGVQVVAPDIKTARKDAAERVKKVMDALADLKIDGLKTKTVDVNVEIIYSRKDEEEAKLPRQIGYRITETFTALVTNDKDTEKLSADAGRVLDAVLGAGVNEVQKIVIFRQDDTEARRQALTKAVEDALANAKAMADGAGIKKFETFHINGEPEFVVPFQAQALQNAAPAAAEQVGSTVIAGDVEVTCRVNVVCTF